MFLLLFFYAIMACVYTFGKQVILYASPLFLTGIRVAGGGVCFLAYQYFFDNENFRIERKSLPLLATFAVAVFFMDNFRLQALYHIPSSNAALIACTAPFMAAVLSWLWFNKTFKPIQIAALFVGAFGMLPMLLEHVSAPQSNCTQILLSYGLVAAATLGFVVCGIISKTLIQKQGCPFFMTVGTAMTGGGLLGFLFSFILEPWNPVPISNFWPAVKLISLLFFTHSLIAYPLYNYLVQKYPVTLVAFAQLSVPFFTGILSYIAHGERLGIQYFISLLLLSCSFWLFYREEFKNPAQMQ